MEQQILQIAKDAIEKGIVDGLGGYHGPMTKLCNRVISEHEDEIYGLINDEFSKLLNASDFREALAVALNQKLAKVLIGRMGGELESRVNKLKADPTARARITIAIEEVVAELSMKGPLEKNDG